MGIGRALTNLIGNCVATVVIARWENDIDLQRTRSVLNGEPGANKTLVATPGKGELRG